MQYFYILFTLKIHELSNLLLSTHSHQTAYQYSVQTLKIQNSAISYKFNFKCKILMWIVYNKSTSADNKPWYRAPCPGKCDNI